MVSLSHSISADTEPQRYPESLVRAGIERRCPDAPELALQQLRRLA